MGFGIDIGSTNTKVAVVRVDDDAHAALVLTCPTPSHGVTVRSSILTLLAEALEQCGPPDAVGIASMAETGFVLDAEDDPLTPLIRWQDLTAPSVVDALGRELGREALFAATGTRLSGKVPLAQWRSLQSAQPGLLGPRTRWTGMADWVHLVLTDELVTDHTLAGRTAAYRLDGRADFDHDLLAAVELRPGQLPRVALPADQPAQAVRGVPTGTPVVVAGHDHQVAAWAAGVRDPGDVVNSVGTAEALMTIVADLPEPPQPVADNGRSIVRTLADDHRALLGGSPSSGAFLAWLASHHGRDVAALTAAAALTHLPTGTLVLPYPSGRQCPYPDPTATVRTIPPDAPVTIESALEALVLQAAWILRVQSAPAGQPPGPLTVVGGPVRRTPVWAQLKATLHAEPVGLVAEQEPVAVGAALVALDRCGYRVPTLPTPQVAPLDALVSHYRERLAAFIAAATEN